MEIMARLKLLLGLLVVVRLAIWLKLPAHAATMTFTGADLFNNPNVSFSTIAPTVSRSSLIIAPTTISFEKLLVLPLIPAGSLSGAIPEPISVSINLTRLTDDYDPRILLSDGSNLVGAAIQDNNGGEAFGNTLIDLGNVIASVERTTGFVGAGYPAVGGSFDINLDWTLQSGLTTVDFAFGSGSASHSEITRALNPTSAIDFVFVAENDTAENYQINSLTVTTPVSGPIPPNPIPEPSSLLLLGSGLAGLAAWRRKKAA